MKTIIAAALGFMAARQIYIKYDKQQALEKEAKYKQKIKELLEELGVTGKDYSHAQIIRDSANM